MKAGRAGVACTVHQWLHLCSCVAVFSTPHLHTQLSAPQTVVSWQVAVLSSAANQNTARCRQLNAPPRHSALPSPCPLPAQLWEGFETTNNNIVVLGATNKKENLDDAVLRRFSLQYEVGAQLCCALCRAVRQRMQEPRRCQDAAGAHREPHCGTSLAGCAPHPPSPERR